MPPIEFSTYDTPLIDLKFKLVNLLHYTDNQRVPKIEYRSSTIDNEGKMRFDKSELKTNEDVRVMWSMFHRHVIKNPIELDVTYTR